jgi:predicted Zn-dependent protease
VQHFLVSDVALATQGESEVNLAPEQLPKSAPHSLPPVLAQWQDKSASGNYFDQITPSEAGYLVWSEFPIRIYIEPEDIEKKTPNIKSPTSEAIAAAIQEWNRYLPLAVVELQESADIIIRRSPPPLRVSSPPPNLKTPTLLIERVRSAETRYTLYLQRQEGSPPILSHHCTIFLNPRQTSSYIQAAIRHELGHALGIWGHSPLPSDAMYFSQVPNSTGISSRDVNTLRLVYEQPTSIGWPLGETASGTSPLNSILRVIK